jgi:hypothetical protein
VPRSGVGGLARNLTADPTNGNQSGKLWIRLFYGRVRDQRRLLNAYLSRRLPQQIRRSRWVESSGLLPGQNVDVSYPRSP